LTSEEILKAIDKSLKDKKAIESWENKNKSKIDDFIELAISTDNNSSALTPIM
jgi:hypothetical protein